MLFHFGPHARIKRVRRFATGIENVTGYGDIEVVALAIDLDELVERPAAAGGSTKRWDARTVIVVEEVKRNGIVVPTGPRSALRETAKRLIAPHLGSVLRWIDGASGSLGSAMDMIVRGDTAEFLTRATLLRPWVVVQPKVAHIPLTDVENI